jgi:CBS domain-containing protein
MPFTSENGGMRVNKVFHPNPVSIEAWQSLRVAARLMSTGEFSCLPVVSGDDLVGIITERDLVEALASTDRPASTPVFDYMSEGPKTVGLDDDCSLAVTEMLATGCRHLPVMDHGKLVGIVSARDLLPLAATAHGERVPA